MKVQAVNNTKQLPPCQPIKPEFSTQSFSQNKVDNDSKDTFTSSNKNFEEKFDFACRLAAYYKTQYENLLKTGGVIA